MRGFGGLEGLGAVRQDRDLRRNGVFFFLVVLLQFQYKPEEVLNTRIRRGFRL